MNAAAYLCCSIAWSVMWFGAGVLCTLAVQAILNHWRHQ